MYHFCRQGLYKTVTILYPSIWRVRKLHILGLSTLKFSLSNHTLLNLGKLTLGCDLSKLVFHFSISFWFYISQYTEIYAFENLLLLTAWKVSQYGVISGPYFPAFGLNTGKYGPEITQYLDTFHALTF